MKKYTNKRLCCGYEEKSNHKMLALYKCLKCGEYNPKIDNIKNEE